MALALVLTPFFMNGQILIGKKAIAKHAHKQQVEEGWDIVLDPIESMPRKITKSRSDASAITNWGRDLLLPSAIKDRLDKECTWPVIIKVGDTGNPNHDYLLSGHLPPTNYTTDPTSDDGHGHSTHVCGIIAAKEFGLVDVLVNKGLVKFKACKVLNNSGSGSFDWVAMMFQKEFQSDFDSMKRGTFVVYNMSLGGGTSKIANVEAAMRATTDIGVFIAVAAGNTSGPGVQYPGNSSYVIATASLDQSPLTRSSYSSYGPEVMVAMPGRNINSTYKGNSFAVLSGTSMASPFNCAVIAIARSKWGPKLVSTDHLKAYLAKCASDISPAGRDEFTGWGIEYIKNILDLDPSTVGTNPPPPPPVVNPDSLQRESRILTIPLTGDWKIAYNPTIATPVTKGWWIFKKPVQSAMTSAGVDPLVSSTLTVTKIEVAVTTKFYFPFTTKQLVDGTNWFFKNRGLQLSGPSDLNDGLNWTAYFYDMLLFSQKGVNIDVLRIEGKDPSGRQIVISGSAVKKYAPK